MPTDNLQLTQIAANQDQKEVTANAALLQLSSALADSKSYDLSAGNAAVSTGDYENFLIFETTGNAISRNLTLPAHERAAVLIKNGGSATLNIVVGSTTLTLASGKYGFYRTDGTTNGLEAISLATAAAAFTSLSDVPANYTSASRKTVRVNAAANALEFIDTSYTLAFYQEAVMTDAEIVYKFIATVPVTLPAGLSGSYANAEVASAGNVHFDIKKNGSDLGDITFNTSATGSFTLASDLSLAAGDILIISGPATHDANLAGVAISLKGYLT
jgi:hypothetical protein